MLTLDQQNTLRQQYQRRRPDWQPATERYAALVQAHLQPPSLWLDVGCGRGGLVEQLNHPAAQTVGMDPDLNSLREHRLPHLLRVAAASHHLPLAHGSIDCVTASWVLEHLEQPAQDFHEIGRVLRPGGRFIFITPHRRHPLIQLNRLIGRLSGLQQRLVSQFYGRAAADTFPAYYRANTPATLAQLGRQTGLRLITLSIIPDPSYWGFWPPLFPLMCRLEELLPSRLQIHLVGVLQRQV